MDDIFSFELDLFEELPPQQSAKAVVMIGRLNPPTAGHYTVINALKKFARENNVTPFLIVIEGPETSKDLLKNPLSGDDRIKIITASGKANGVKMLIASNAMAGFEAVRAAGYEPYAIAAGSDRAAKYIELLDKYFTGPNGEKLKHVVADGLADREDPDADGTPSEEILALAEQGEDIPVFMISGSMARLAVKLGYKKAFAKILGVKQELADWVFKKVERSLHLGAEQAAKAEAEVAAKAAEKERIKAEKEAAKAAAKAAKKVK